MTELSALNVRINGDASGAVSAAASTVSALGKVDAAAAKVGVSVEKSTGALARFGKSASGSSLNAQQFGWQVSQMGQSIAAGTPAINAITMQLGDLLPMLGIGGLTGVAVTAAAVMIPLAASFLSGEDGAKKLANALDVLRESTDAVNASTKTYTAEGVEGLRQKYGELTNEILSLVEAQRLRAISKAEEGAINAVRALAQEYRLVALEAGSTGRQAEQSFSVMANQLGITKDQARQLSAALYEFRQADSFEKQASALTKMRTLLEQSDAETTTLLDSVMDAEDAMRQLAKSAPESGWLNAAISQASTLASTLWDAVRAKAAVAGPDYANMDDDRRQAIEENRAGMQDARAVTLKRTQKAWLDTYNKPGKKGGGGKKKEDPLIDDLEQLRESLLTQEAAQVESYMRQQETLKSALEQKLLTQKEYNALMEQAQTQHQEAMSQIDAYRYGDAALKFQTFMGDMASALSGGNDKMMRMARVFGAFEATINAWRAYNQTLADPSLPFFAKFAAAASVLSAGLGAVNAIKGGGGGGRGGSSAAAAGGSAQAPQQVNLNTYGGGDFIRGADFGMMLDKLNQEAGDRGYKLMWNPS